jgi:serine protease AprX
VQQVIQYLQSSGSQAANPNNTLGYGIPNFVTAYNLAHPNNPLSAGTADPAEQLALYPNPGRDEELFLHLSPAFRTGLVQVRLFDARGTLVRELQLTPAAADVRLPTLSLAKGIYTCLVSTDSVQQTVRLVKL